MAQLIHAGEFATEGERRAAEALRRLPDSWVVICNKTLVTRNARSFEIDFLVLGDHYVFAIDEKAWSGRIHGSDQEWVRADSSSERSPLGKIEYVANVLAGELRYQVPRLREVSAHFVHGAVLLSAATEPPRVRDPRAADGVFLLDGVVERLVAFDSRANHQPITAFRAGIQTALFDLRDRPRFPERIGEYRIEEIISNRPGSYVARAVHELAGPRTLVVYDVARATPETRAFYLRAFEAVQRLQPTGLVAEVLDPFTWSEDFLVVPSAPPPGKALATLKPPEGVDDLSGELALAALAFDALATIHAQGVVHRALSPDTVYVQGSAREPRGVVFSGFFAARVEGPTSVAAQLDELAIADPYAAPELALSYGMAEPDSGVYSLALVFCERIAGMRASELRALGSLTAARDQLAARWPQLPSSVLDGLVNLFGAALSQGRMAPADSPHGARPSAADCAARLRALGRQLRTTAAEAGGLLDGRYRVLRKLGEGAYGRTYLATDEELDASLPRAFVVKVFHQPELVREQAGREFATLRAVHSPHVPRLYDVYPPTHDVHLKMDYVPGPSLAEVRSEFPWDEARWWRFAEGLLAALGALERHGLRHRDLKTEQRDSPRG